MLAGTLKRYWTTLAGGAVIAAVIVASGLLLGQRAVGDLVRTGIAARATTFADFLVSDQGAVDAFLTGIAREADAESGVRTVALLSNISSFTIFDRTGKEVFSTRSDRYDWLMRDKPGGMDTGNRLSSAVVERTSAWPIVEDASTDAPSAIAPLLRGGRTIGYVSVRASMITERFDYSYTLTGASIALLGVVLLVTGVPGLLYLRHRRRIHEADDRIEFLANHDALTGLLNRTRIQEDMDRLAATSRATREKMAVWFIDVDRLADINDGCGQAVGDEVLRTVAQRLGSAVDRNDLLARLGNDDFGIVQRRLASPAALAELAERIERAMKEPVTVRGQSIVPAVSMGVALMPEHGRFYAEIVKHAELAFLHNKRLKQGGFTLFEPFMDEEAHHRRAVESMTRAALENDGFELFYQPIVGGASGVVVGLEALVRLRDGTGGYVAPGVFIPIAEARGYVKAIGTWVIKEAARQAAAWPDELFVSINLSPVQFEDGDLVDIVAGALSASRLPGRRLEIEVVESLLLNRSDGILDQLRGLKALGVSIDMDDFGTGYSSLGYLWRFPFDKLKIDQSFMAAFEQGEANVPQILETIVSLAHHMGMKVTAEGIETRAQAEFLEACGCDQLQGFFFGRPMPADRVAAEILTSLGKRATEHDPEVRTASHAVG